MKQRLFDTPIEDKPHSVGNGIHKIYKFENGYGASVVRFAIPTEPFAKAITNITKVLKGEKSQRYGSYTNNEKEWELAVIKFDKEGGWELDYNTPITNDVIGHLTESGVEKILQKIKKLK